MTFSDPMSRMENISFETCLAAVEILGEQGYEFDESAKVEERIRDLVSEDISARRLIDIIPEAFGIVLISHMPAAADMKFSDCFYAKDQNDNWQPIPVKQEPVFAMAVTIAQHIFHNGPRHSMKNIADRSSIVDTVNKALNVSGNNALAGSTNSGPKFFGLPASLYAPR